MIITKVQAISASYPLCLGGHIPKPGLTVFMQTALTVCAWGCYLHIEKELRRLQLQLCISVPGTLQKCFPVYMCERVSILVITQLQTMRPKSRG